MNKCRQKTRRALCQRILPGFSHIFHPFLQQKSSRPVHSPYSFFCMSVFIFQSQPIFLPQRLQDHFCTCSFPVLPCLGLLFSFRASSQTLLLLPSAAIRLQSSLGGLENENNHCAQTLADVQRPFPMAELYKNSSQRYRSKGNVSVNGMMETDRNENGAGEDSRVLISQ